jgi:hypothetical protein
MPTCSNGGASAAISGIAITAPGLSATRIGVDVIGRKLCCEAFQATRLTLGGSAYSVKVKNRKTPAVRKIQPHRGHGPAESAPQQGLLSEQLGALLRISPAELGLLLCEDSEPGKRKRAMSRCSISRH